VDVSFKVEEGEIFGFIGPNGAGKSTTIRLFLSLIFPSSGEAKIFGKDAIKHGPELRQEIGYLPSEVFYYEKMKVIDLLKYSASFYKKDCTERLYELAEIMELDLKRRIDDLSYGNKKKENEVRGATVFFSSHILGEVQKMCNRVAIIKEGTVIRIEQIATLQKDNYKKIRVTADDLDEKRYDIEGVSNLIKENGVVSFLFKGDINVMAKLISEKQIFDVTIEEPTLEEIFMHYYE